MRGRRRRSWRRVGGSGTRRHHDLRSYAAQRTRAGASSSPCRSRRWRALRRRGRERRRRRRRVQPRARRRRVTPPNHSDEHEHHRPMPRELPRRELPRRELRRRSPWLRGAKTRRDLFGRIQGTRYWSEPKRHRKTHGKRHGKRQRETQSSQRAYIVTV